MLILFKTITPIFLLLYLHTTSLESAPSATLTLPPNWKLVPQKKYPPLVTQVITGPSAYWYPPSISVAEEQYTGSLKDYVSNTKSLLKKNFHMSFRVLGPFQTPLGTGTLCVGEELTHYGKIKYFQWLGKKDNKICVITAGARKEEFRKNYPLLLKTLIHLKTD